MGPPFLCLIFDDKLVLHHYKIPIVIFVFQFHCHHISKGIQARSSFPVGMPDDLLAVVKEAQELHRLKKLFETIEDTLLVPV